MEQKNPSRFRALNLVIPATAWGEQASQPARNAKVQAEFPEADGDFLALVRYVTVAEVQER